MEALHDTVTTYKEYVLGVKDQGSFRIELQKIQGNLK
jgi:hypothetical protein